MIAKDAEKARSRFAGVLQKGIAVTLHWEAGGDQRVVLIHYDGREETRYEEEEELLIQEVASILSLPGAGEEFNTGSGRLVLENNGNIVLVFSAYEFTFPENDGKVFKTMHDDPFNTFALTADSYTSFRYSYNYFTETYEMELRCWNKKTFADTLVPEKARILYQALLNDAIKQHIEAAGKIADTTGFEINAEVIAVITFPEPGKLECHVAYELNKITGAHKEEKIMLFETRS
jgi:hypothetical protein